MPIDPILHDLPEQGRRFRTEEQPNEQTGRQDAEPPLLGMPTQALLRRDELRLTKKPPINPFEALIRFRQRRKRETDDKA